MTLSLAIPKTERSQCQNCGHNLHYTRDAQKQIEELQAQVKLLTEKATAAVDKWADYEDEIRQLRAKLSSNQTAPQALQNGPITKRLSIFMPSRKAAPIPFPQTPALTPTPISPHEEELITALTREQVLRHEAEGRLSEASGELEELSAQLFMQANEMVATERKARAKLEERVALLESRDGEKRKRLERLELAMSRIERVRGILAPGNR